MANMGYREGMRLGPPTKAITALDRLKKRGSAKKQKNKGSEEKKVSWRDLLAFDDVIKDLRIRVEKFVEMKSRNKKVVAQSKTTGSRNHKYKNSLQLNHEAIRTMEENQAMKVRTVFSETNLSNVDGKQRNHIGNGRHGNMIIVTVQSKTIIFLS
ncbi:hypothetical protein NC651_008815 [Populus alba x Populus x berolinensis]|nr:hypothetical protein NC651_008815 [Populus alba x Populus x berolinensis]